MTRLTPDEADGLCRVLNAEHQSQRAAAAALAQFGSVPVVVHLQESAGRHMTVLTDVLRAGGLDVPVLVPVLSVRHESLIAALEAVFDQETRTAGIYDQLLDTITRPDLRRIMFNLWQSTSHRHRAAIAHRLNIEQPADPG